MSRDYYNYDLDADNSSAILSSAKVLSIASSRYTGGWNSVPHTHNHTELFFIVSGRGRFIIQDQQFPVSANNMVIINPNVMHTEVSYNAQPLEYIVLGIEGLELAVSKSSNGKFIILDHFESAELSACLINILREIEHKKPGYEDVCKAYMDILIIRLMRSIVLAVPPEAKTLSANRQCAAIRRYIDLHFKEPLSLEQLAEEGHINKFYLSHAFKREYGISPINYMIAKRVDESKHLLAETNLSLSQIAQMLGFSSQSYFSQVFRRSQNLSPTEYRQKHKRL